MTACIVGWSHLPFGKHEGTDVEDMIVKVASGAVADAGFEPKDVDAIYLGHFGGAFSPQAFTASLVLQASDDFRFKPATRVENACATGSSAVHQGVDFIEARRGKVVLVVGVEKMTDLKGPAIGETLLTASYLKEEAGIEGGFAGVFGQIAQAYFQRHGDQERCAGSDRGKEPQERRIESLCSDTQGSRLHVLPRDFGEEPPCRWPAQANGLLARL